MFGVSVPGMPYSGVIHRQCHRTFWSEIAGFEVVACMRPAIRWVRVRVGRKYGRGGTFCEVWLREVNW